MPDKQTVHHERLKSNDDGAMPFGNFYCQKDAARAIGPKLAEQAVLVRADGVPQDLRLPLPGGAKLQILTTRDTQDPDALAVLRETCTVAKVPLLLSMHDFERTPSPDLLLAAFAHMAALGADIAKLAVMPQSEADVVALLEATSRADRSLAIPLVGISMGALGTPSRVLGHRFGSRITWCSGVEASAPGQLPLELLRRLIEEARTP